MDQNEGQELPVMGNEQPLLRVKITEGAADQIEAEGAESAVLHLVNQWHERLDKLRAEATAVMDRMQEAGTLGQVGSRRSGLERH